MNRSALKAAFLAPLTYIRSVHSEATADSHGRWTVTAFMVLSGGVLGHAQAHHLALDPTISTTLLGIGGLVLGRATASKIFGEKEPSPDCSLRASAPQRENLPPSSLP